MEADMGYGCHECDFAEKVRHEIEAARRSHPKPINSPSEAYGVIAEELAEFFDEVRKKRSHRQAMAHELVQVAAMCQRAAEDLGLPVEAVLHRHRFDSDDSYDRAAREVLKALG